MSRILDAEMKAGQFSVFLENRAGRLAEVIHLLAEAGVNIRAISLADTSDFGILRMMLTDCSIAEDTLKKQGFTTGHTDVVAVELDDTPGSLDTLLQQVSQNGVNVEYMYAYARRTLSKPVMIFRFDKIDQAIELLRKGGFTLIPGNELREF